MRKKLIAFLFVALFLFSYLATIPTLPNQVSKELPKIPKSSAESPPGWTNSSAIPTHAAASGQVNFFCAPQNAGQVSTSTGYCLAFNSTNLPTADEFFSSTMSATGLGSWTRLSPLATADGTTLQATEPFFYTGDLFVVGGEKSNGFGASISSDYSGGAWHANTSYPAAQYGLGCASTTGLALCVGGDNSGVLTKASYTWGGSTWSALHQYPIGIFSPSCVGYSGTIYCMGGTTNGSAATKNTYYTTDGITWTPTTAFPAGYTSIGGLPFGSYCTEDQGYVYCLDGHTTPLLFYAQLSGSGIGAWTQATNAPQALTLKATNLFSYDNAAGSLFTAFSNLKSAGTSTSEYSTPAFTFAETLVCKLLSTGGTTETLALSGAANPSPTTASCSTAGSSNSITVSPSAALTITAPANSTNSAYIGNSSWASAQTVFTFTTGSSAESHTIYQYQVLENTYAMNPSTPSKWDGAYTKNVNGTYTGAASIRCTLSLASGGGSVSKACWADNDTSIGPPSSFASSVAGTWAGTAPTSFTDTTGGNTRTVNFNLGAAITITNGLGLSTGSTKNGANQNTTANSFTVDYGSNLFVYGQLAGKYTNIIANQYIDQEPTIGFQVLSNVGIASLSYDGTAGVLSWTCSASCTTITLVPAGLIVLQSLPNPYTQSGNYYTVTGSSGMSISFQTSSGSSPTPGGNVAGSSPTTATQTTASDEAVVSNLIGAGNCVSNPITTTTTATSLTTVTYTSVGSATTYTTKIHIDHDDDQSADRNQPDQDDFQTGTIPGSVQTETTTLTQSQVATITSASVSCSISTTITQTVTNFSTSQLINQTLPHPHPAIPPGSANSTNWAGYVIQSSPNSITQVSGSFIIPQISCSSRGYIAIWAGIDGYVSNTVEQGGVLGICNAAGATYTAWFEFYPSPMTTILNMTVKPGDKMFVQVSYQNPSFLVNVQDITANESYSVIQQNTNASRSSAEWITEAPSDSGVLPLAAFGKDFNGLNYTGILNSDYLTVNGSTSQIGFNPSIAVTLVKMFGGTNTVLAYPSPLTTDEASFIVYGTAIVTSDLLNYLPWLAILAIIIGVLYMSRKKGSNGNKLVPKVTKTKGLR